MIRGPDGQDLRVAPPRAKDLHAHWQPRLSKANRNRQAWHADQAERENVKESRKEAKKGRGNEQSRGRGRGREA